MVSESAIVKEEHVEKALKAHVGEQSTLLTWNLESSVSQGATASIKRIRVSYKADNGETIQTSFIAKMDIGASGRIGKIKNKMYFEKEKVFYEDIAPLMKDALSSLQRNLSIPRCLFSTSASGAELTLMEDLANRGFTSARSKPRKELDFAHLLLVVREIAVFHASSLIVEHKDDVLLEEKYPILQENWYENYPHKEIFDKWWTMQIQIAADVAQEEGKRYEKEVRWLKSLQGKVSQTLVDLARPSSSKFSVLLHNDCWGSNIMFRYDEIGVPCEVSLVDLQMTMKGTPVTDLIFLMFISMAQDERRKYWKNLLQSYYQVFASALGEAGLPVPFSLEELVLEFQTKLPYGVIFSINFSGIFFLGGIERVPAPISDEEEEQYPKNMRDATLRVFQRPIGGDLLASIYLGALDDLSLIGIPPF